ncbi:MAG: DUF3604 domain-containing protein, partial [bacterium]
ASGYAAVWAHENTRASIFDAMRRKEVYATTGSRIALRFFGGWEFEASDAQRADAARVGYRKGVPMGGDLTSTNDGKKRAPGFLLSATKDPHGANLDRIQVIKGWRDAKGELHEKVYEAALSDGRTPNRKGRAKALKSTVDVEAATYSNSIGAVGFSTYWQDPDFDPKQSAFYYARVIEIPTPRWPAYDVKRLGAESAANMLMEIQDRAYSSPIWYTP